MTKLIRPLQFISVLVLLFSAAWFVAASESSFIDTVKNSDEPFDNRSVTAVQPITEKTVLARETLSGRLVSRADQETGY